MSLLASFALLYMAQANAQSAFGANSYRPNLLNTCNGAANRALIAAESTAEGKASVRNDIVKEVEQAVVVSQQSYMGRIDRHRNVAFTTLDIVNLGLTAAAGAVGGPAAAKAFALSATAVVGIKSSVSTYFNSGQGATALLVRMETSFGKNQAILDQKLQAPYAKYGLGDACADVELLRDSGQEVPAGAGIINLPTAQPAGTPQQAP